MEKKLKIPFPIIVEGRYDKQKLSLVCDAHIITTEGFGIFKSQERLCLIKKLAEKSPIIVLTDSDGAGKVIRSHISSAIPKDKLIQLYIPQIKGKEKRKEKPSAEGTLGVEGMQAQLLYDLLSPFADESALTNIAQNPLSKVDLYKDGLTGGADSSAKRDALALSLGLPAGMSANALLAALCILLSFEEYVELVRGKKEI